MSPPLHGNGKSAFQVIQGLEFRDFQDHLHRGGFWYGAHAAEETKIDVDKYPRQIGFVGRLELGQKAHALEFVQLADGMVLPEEFGHAESPLRITTQRFVSQGLRRQYIDDGLKHQPDRVFVDAVFFCTDIDLVSTFLRDVQSPIRKPDEFLLVHPMVRVQGNANTDIEIKTHLLTNVLDPAPDSVRCDHDS